MIDFLRSAGVSIHAICTGAGAGLQRALWEQPGASAYLSGASFPYAREETAELLGFEPEKYVSVETAADLASAAYMAAYRFGGPKPVGLGLTAAVASETARRGRNRVCVCVVTDAAVRMADVDLGRAHGAAARWSNEQTCTSVALGLLTETLSPALVATSQDATDLLASRLFARPFFTADGRRLTELTKPAALMPGAYNPPHEGHYGMAAEVERLTSQPVVHQVTSSMVHKPALTPQELLKRARLLRGRNRLVTQGDALYLDKARMFPDTAFVIGADALARMLDPKWGPEPTAMLCEFSSLGTSFYVAARDVNGRRATVHDVLDAAGVHSDLRVMFKELRGEWQQSSTAIRQAAGV